jgi:NADH:ubiquinone oxidoreductase subunit 5 (subunit L)/multisubunit Na+/H+ antiporter MnhA subunit
LLVAAGGIAAAASGAASGSRPSSFTFDPSTTLGWAVPLIVLAPLAAFVIAITSVRTRRASANLTLFGATVTALATLLCGWGLANKTAPFRAVYQYLNISVAFSGPVNFQSFGIDIILRVDHLTVIALLVVELCVIGAVGWHRVMGRGEPGAARFHALMSLFLFGAVATLVSWDLAELFAFWGLTGGMTYLLLAHRWGADEPARRARIALALPFLTDLSLMCGIGVLYSRYGKLDLDALIPILHTTPNAGGRSLVVASILLFVGVAGRLGLWPLQSWVTNTAVAAPPAASAVAQSVWSVVAVTVLYRVLPIFAAANPQALRACLYMCGAAAVVAPLLALFGNEPRRIVALLGSGVAAVGAAVALHGFQNPLYAYAAVGVACVFAAAPARAAGVLSASAVAGAMRTDDLSEMGDGLTRMRASTVVLLIAALVLGLSASAALAYGVDSRSQLGIALGEGVLLVSVGALRVWLAIAIGPLRRRRAFEPDRVRDAPPASLGWPYWLALAGLVLTIASFLTGWVRFLDGHTHPAPAVAAIAVWAAIALVGFAVAAVSYLRDKDGALKGSSTLGAWLGTLLATGTAAFGRFVLAPSGGIVGGATDVILATDDGLGRASMATGRGALLTARWPAVPVIVLLAVLLALLVGLVSPGVFR